MSIKLIDIKFIGKRVSNTLSGKVFSGISGNLCAGMSGA